MLQIWNIYQKQQYIQTDVRQTHAPDISDTVQQWPVSHLTVRFLSSIKPFAQPPYPSISGPVPQSLSSEYQTRSFWSCSKLKSCLLINDSVYYVPSRLWTLGTASCTDCHRRAGVAGPDHRLLKAADAGVLSLHGGPKRPRQRESLTCKTPNVWTGDSLIIK